MWQITLILISLSTLCNGQGPKPAPPQITEFFQNDLVAPDEVKFRDNVNWQLNLPCRATGSNKLSWEWRHNDSIINPNKFEFDDDWQLSQDGTLKAKGLSISDSGTYQCFVTDTVTDVKTFSRKLRVAVTAVGQFNDELPITSPVELGKPFDFDCPPHGPSSLVSFTWTSASKKELNIQFPRSERVAIDPSNGALHIMYVTPEDITHIRDLGGIQCTMSGANTFFSSGALTFTTIPGVPDPAIFSIPSFTSATSNSVEVAVEGRSKVLYCQATARPYPTITWKKNGKVLQDGVDFFKIPSPFHGRLLNITKVDENMHEDIYTCQASNNQTIGTGPQERNINLQVEVAPRWIVEPPRLQKISIASNANLSCDVYAEPEPQIKWFRDGVELVASSKVRQVNTDLLFSDLTLNEAGIYQCVAENKHGVIVSSTYVEALEPGPPSDVKIYAFPKYVLVTWKPPLEPNGIITKYRVGLKTYTGSEPKDVEVEMQETGADARKKLLEMLEPETNYVIEIQAMTAIGWGKGVRKTTKTVPWTAPAKPEKPVIEGTASDAVRVDYKFGLGGGYTHEFLVMFRKKLVGEEFQNTTWINHFLEQSVLIRHLDPVLYEFKTLARSDYPLKANPQESPASDVVEGRPLPGVISAGKQETTPVHKTVWFIALLVLAYLCTL